MLNFFWKILLGFFFVTILEGQLQTLTGNVWIYNKNLPMARTLHQTSYFIINLNIYLELLFFMLYHTTYLAYAMLSWMYVPYILFAKNRDVFNIYCVYTINDSTVLYSLNFLIVLNYFSLTCHVNLLSYESITSIRMLSPNADNLASCHCILSTNFCITYVSFNLKKLLDIKVQNENIEVSIENHLNFFFTFWHLFLM